jgi:hypothetical protein
MIVESLIKASMRKCGIIASGENPTPEELADGLEALQLMLRSLAGVRVFVYASTKESVTLTPTTLLYTWGVGGTINTARPNVVLGASLTYGGNDFPVSIITEGKYRNIISKTSQGRSSQLFYHPTYPLGNVYLYPSPDQAYVLNLDSMKPFTETSSFDDTSSTLAFPVTYEEMLVYGLAVRLAPEFGKTLSAETIAIAISLYDRIVSLNAANQVEPISIFVPAGLSYGAGYDININE